MNNQPIAKAESMCWINSEGYLHREDGPAKIHLDGKNEFYYDGDWFTFEEWCEITNKTNEEIVQLKLQYGS